MHYEQDHGNLPSYLFSDNDYRHNRMMNISPHVYEVYNVYLMFLSVHESFEFYCLESGVG